MSRQPAASYWPERQPSSPGRPDQRHDGARRWRTPLPGLASRLSPPARRDSPSVTRRGSVGSAATVRGWAVRGWAVGGWAGCAGRPGWWRWSCPGAQTLHQDWAIWGHFTIACRAPGAGRSGTTRRTSQRAAGLAVIEGPRPGNFGGWAGGHLLAGCQLPGQASIMRGSPSRRSLRSSGTAGTPLSPAVPGVPGYPARPRSCGVKGPGPLRFPRSCALPRTGPGPSLVARRAKRSSRLTRARRGAPCL